MAAPHDAGPLLPALQLPAFAGLGLGLGPTHAAQHGSLGSSGSLSSSLGARPEQALQHGLHTGAHLAGRPTLSGSRYAGADEWGEMHQQLPFDLSFLGSQGEQHNQQALHHNQRASGGSSLFGGPHQAGTMWF